jgi:hypothetical protein
MNKTKYTGRLQAAKVVLEGFSMFHEEWQRTTPHRFWNVYRDQRNKSEQWTASPSISL